MALVQVGDGQVVASQSRQAEEMELDLLRLGVVQLQVSPQEYLLHLRKPAGPL